MSNNDFRIKLRQQRRTLAAEFCKLAAEKIATQLFNNKFFIQSKKIACYLPNENEVDTWPLIKIIAQQEKTCYLPLLDPANPNELLFSLYNDKTELVANKFSILEPKFNRQNIILPHELDLVLLPLVAFNKNFFRCGRGAGFYDRTFAFKISNPQQKPYLVGLGYAFQEVDFQPNPWDVPMDLVITE